MLFAFILFYFIFVQEPIGKTAELAEFLGLEKNEEFFKEVAEQCSFKKMKASKAKDTESFRTPGASLYRKGRVFFFNVCLFAKIYIPNWKESVHLFSFIYQTAKC